MNNLRGLLSIRKMDRFLNAQIKKWCRVREGVGEKIEEVFSGGLAMWRE